ncbi:hypothetical protein CsSME_00030551 [Camellia sinensis var. sinensis]
MVKVKQLVSLRRLSPRTHHLFPKTHHFFPKIADQIASQTPSLCLSLLVTNPSSHIPNKPKMKMETKNADHPPPFRRSQITKIQEEPGNSGRQAIISSLPAASVISSNVLLK